MVTGNGIGSLTISWTSRIEQGVTVTFNLAVVNVNSSSSERTIVPSIETQSYNFSTGRAPTCDVYSFHVVALNDAGASSPSEEVTRSLPSLPDLSGIEDLLQHTLNKTANGVILSASFMVKSCYST